MRIVFMGTPELAATVLSRLCDEKYDVVLVVTQPDKPVGRKMVLTAPPAKVEAEKRGFNFSKILQEALAEKLGLSLR